VADVEEHRARGVAHVGGVHAAAGELVQQPAVDGAEGQLALRGGDVRAGHVVEQPADLGAAEVGVDDEPGARAQLVGQAVLAQLRAQRLGAAVLPDDGAVDRHAAGAPPHHRGLALVGDADGRDVGRPQPGRGQRLARHGELRRPDLLGVVLHPAGLRKVLGELALRQRGDAAVAVEDDGARAGGALVEGEQVVLGHGLSPVAATLPQPGGRARDTSRPMPNHA
jgi:hypothetical protein